MERWAVPVHTVINCVFNSRMPISFGKRIVVSNNVTHRVTVLETSELALAITNTKNQVTGSFGGLHSVDRFFKGLVPLENVSEDEGKGISEPALFTKSIVRIANSNFRNGKLVFVDSRKHTDPS